MKDGFIKTAAASPVIRVADAEYNADKIIEAMRAAAQKDVRLLVFPELTLTGVTLYDLFLQRTVVNGANEALKRVVRASIGLDMLVFVGLPFIDGTRLYSCAAAIYEGAVLGLVPRTEVGGSHFAAPEAGIKKVTAAGMETLFGTGLIFQSRAAADFRAAAELGDDMNAVITPGAKSALNGATVIAQLACFPMTVCSKRQAQLQIRAQSERMLSALVLAAPGYGESTTDNVYSGFCAVCEGGKLLAEDEGEDTLAISEIDVNYLSNQRLKTGKFGLPAENEIVLFGGAAKKTELTRYYSKNPHLPELAADIPEYCRRMTEIQVSGLVKRMKYAGLDHCVVGISGGVDSTLCVMICAMAVERMGLPSANVIACTMPCFGTTSRTKSNAIVVAEQIGAEVRIIDIGESVNRHFDDIGHARDDYRVTFENAQARERTQILMDIANGVNGLNVGTEDLSEFIDGWCTYNGDHTSMYDVNMGLTKTQVRAAVRHIAQNTDDKILAAALWDVLDCPVSPELLPPTNDEIEQKSEDTVGSYSLQDFYTHKLLICGFTPKKAFRLAKIAYADEFDDAELIKWLDSYCRRLFSQQFKRSCLMDGPAVEEFSVSPRSGFQMPSDGMASLYLKELEELREELK